MSKCNDCAFAAWERTRAGKLHPSGDGRCVFPHRTPPIPAAYCWGYYDKPAPRPVGGWINRRTRAVEFCPTYRQCGALTETTPKEKQS